MRKIIFANDTEIEVADISQSGSGLRIQVATADVNAVIGQFRNNPAATSVMRYYVEADLLRGYAGYTNMVGVRFSPDVVQGIDYNTTDAATESGFAETKADIVTVEMWKAVNVQPGTDTVAAQIAEHETKITSLETSMKELESAIVGE